MYFELKKKDMRDMLLLREKETNFVLKLLVEQKLLNTESCRFLRLLVFS